MKLKKINAALSLLTVLAMFLHIGYTVYAYLTLSFNPVLMHIIAGPFMLLACLHAICGMAIVFLQADGTRLNLYPRKNLGTIIQRLSAALIFPLLILHLNTFNLLQSSANAGKWVCFALLTLSQPLFYGVVLAHVSVSVSRALITLGWLASPEKQKTIDRILRIVCPLVFAAAAYAVVKGQLSMFVH